MNNRTRIAVERQVAAMGTDVFEVGLFKPRVPGDESNEPEMLPRVWDRETLLRSVGWLCFQNTRGRNIYIRPKGEHHLSLVDDLTASAIQRMKADGFGPAVVVETSPGNFQAWLNHGQVLPKQLSTLAARTLAEVHRGAVEIRGTVRTAVSRDCHVPSFPVSPFRTDSYHLDPNSFSSGSVPVYSNPGRRSVIRLRFPSGSAPCLTAEPFSRPSGAVGLSVFFAGADLSGGPL
jgi:RepB DNA-primase from phage plasmid